MALFQPSGQIKLTNVSVVRLKKTGKRFEIACYKNKVMEWRNGVESDIDNVIQTMQVFTNVSKGQVCPVDDLEKAFKTRDIQACVLQILKKGELQVSQLERSNQLETMQKGIINIITEKTVHPETKRPYPHTMIEKAINQLHYSISSSRSSKQQALDIIRQLQERDILPIRRAQMRIHMVMPVKDWKRLNSSSGSSEISELTIDSQDYIGSSDVQVECLIDPGKYRILSDIVQNETKGKGRLDVLSLSETTDGDERIQ